MGNSSLVTYTKLSPNYSKGRKSITGIAIHCMAGNLTVERCGALFANKKTQASSNYGVSGTGIGLYVAESNRSWCTCSGAVDGNCITIEVANNTGAPNWGVSDASLKTLLLLCADICRRNGFRLKWDSEKVAECDKKFAELRKKHKYSASTDKADRKSAYSSLWTPSASHNVPLHRWVSNKACPGNTLVGLMPWICQSTNHLLDGGSISDIVFPGATKYTSTENVEKTVKNMHIYNGVDLSLVYDSNYYANRYEDLRNVYGYNDAMLFTHFCTYGMKEARQAIASFDPIYYRNNNKDLEAKYGNNWLGYYAHYCAFGSKEGRKGAL